ncbi:Nucleolar protein 8 [Toxocara canis]|uniref:Nucleolar protein 8 n=1 Tax=Toxocara canis TaxID=6265 RepID=A0A0B2W0S7_TOXCA|nr:Nucleolar protein 8 [Toxocara canis]
MEYEIAESCGREFSVSSRAQLNDKKAKSEARRRFVKFTLQNTLWRCRVRASECAPISLCVHPCGVSIAEGKSRKSVPLFENEDEESDNDVEVLISNRHFGAKGAKLMAMEAKFSNDERFRMNEKFFEDSNEQEEDEEKMEVEKEKKAKLEILSKVLGKAVRNSVRGKRAAPFSRFDPDNQNHIRWLNEQKLQTAECDQESVEKEDEVDRRTVRKEEEEEEAEKNKMGESRVIEGQYFDVDETFAESLKRTLKIQGSSNETQNGFSFLKSIGRVHSADVETGLEEPKPVSSLTKQSLLPEQDGKKRMDVEGELSESRSEGKLLKTAEGPSTAPADGCFFFITDADRAVANVVEHFRREQSIDVINKHWSSVRMSIIKIYKGQRKLALKRKKEEESRAFRVQFPTLQEKRKRRNEHQKSNSFDAADSLSEKKGLGEERISMKETGGNEKKSAERSHNEKGHIAALETDST